jgi:hypothetical protein
MDWPTCKQAGLWLNITKALGRASPRRPWRHLELRSAVPPHGQPQLVLHREPESLPWLPSREDAYSWSPVLAPSRHLVRRSGMSAIGAKAEVVYRP